MDISAIKKIFKPYLAVFKEIDKLIWIHGKKILQELTGIK
jgi:hypothetical protein